MASPPAAGLLPAPPSSSPPSRTFDRLRRLPSLTRTITPSHAHGPAARAYLVSVRASSSHRLVTDASGGPPLRFVATRAGGDCGWEAISWGLLVARGSSPSGTRIRAFARAHVRSERTAYADACGVPEQVDEFLASVTRTGLSGHWLGQTWGALELVAVARALSCTVRLYAWCPTTQGVRSYFEESAGKDVVRLLFTGSAERGHFDVLLEEPVRKKGFTARWRARAKRKQLEEQEQSR